MRIAFDGTTLRPGRTGVGYYTEHLLHHLAARAVDDEIVVISNRPVDTTRPLPTRVRIATSSWQIPRMLWMQTLGPRLLRRAHVDVVHFTNGMVPLASPVPAVVTIHVLQDKNILLLLSRIAKQPTLDESRARKLLAASFTETGDAAFALHPNTGDLYLRILRGLDGLDYEEFEDLVHSIAQTADHWDDKIAEL